MGERMLRTAADIAWALRRAGDLYVERTSSVLMVGRIGTDPTAEPFRVGFFDLVEERTELLRLLSLVDERSRTLLVLWFNRGLPVTKIARALKISRIHCYRLKDQALRVMVDAVESRAPEHQVTQTAAG